MEYEENKELNEIMQRLIHDDKHMIDFRYCYPDYGCFGEGTKSHWICLTKEYRFYDGLLSIHEQTPSMVWELKNGKIYKLEKPEIVGQSNVYIKDADGNDKNYNPFSNGTYRRRGK